LITLDKIEEWIREVEERPASAPTILRYISRRLSNLTARNEELLSENIALRMGHKVEEYESRIANLEYQLNLLKRQLVGIEAGDLPKGSPGGGIGDPSQGTQAEITSLLLFEPQGHVLRVEFERSGLDGPSHTAATLKAEAISGVQPIRLLAANSQEELLFVFDSGRTETLPVAAITPADPDGLDWSQAIHQEPHAGEELVEVLPIARMSLFDFCIQTSRRGFVKKIKESFLQANIGNHFIGSGVKLPADRACGLTLTAEDDLIVLASKEGYLLALEVKNLPLAIEEAMRLGPTDHIIATINPAGKPSLVVMTQSGKAVHRETSWLEPATAFRSRGQAVFSKARREAGVRAVGAAALDDQDWFACLTSDGRLGLHQASALFSSGSVPGLDQGREVLAFISLSNG
jgi:DNA gyrase/topoisomerase IV subunit A